MNYILNYKKSPHFEERLRSRHIDSFLVSMCLVKGAMKQAKKNNIEYTLNKESITQAITQGYISVRDCLGVMSLTVVVKGNILITVFTKMGDTGIAN